MSKVFSSLFTAIVVIAIGFIGFWCWTEWKHDKSAIQYIKDQIEKEESVDETTDKDIVVEDETGEVEATANINF